MKRFNFISLLEAQDPAIDPNENLQDPNTQLEQPQIDPNTGLPVEDPTQDPNAQPSAADSFEPLIKSAADVPHSKEKAELLKIAAQVRQIEAQTKETLAKAEQPSMDGMGGDPSAMGDPSMGGGQIDPATGMPMDPNMGGVDPMTGMPMDPNAQGQENDPLAGLGDATAPQDPMDGGMDPMTGMPMAGGAGQKTFTAIGRAFKLKKIYDILEALTRTLHTTPDIKLQALYKELDTAFELFRLVVNNLKLYKEKVDDLIIMYYALIKDVCEKVETVYKERKLETSLTESRIFREFRNTERGF